MSDSPIIAGSTLALPDRTLDGTATIDAGLQRWTTHLQRLRDAGFTAVDLVDTWISPAALSGAALADLRDAFASLELQLVGVSVIRKSIIDPQDGERNLEHTLASIEATAALGAPLLCIGFHRPLTDEQKRGAFWLVDGPADSQDERTHALAVERLRTVCDYAARTGIAISLELHERTLLGTGSGAARIVREVGAANLGINPDLGNLYRQPRDLDETWEETLAASLPAMNYWHVKNFRRVPLRDGPIVSFPESLGRGDIDYRHAVEMAVAAGYRGAICIEHYGGDRLVGQADGLSYLSRVLDDVRREADAGNPGKRS